MNRSTFPSSTAPTTLSVLAWSILCPSCELDGDPLTDPGEATYLAGVHNDLHHGRKSDAFVVRIYTQNLTPTGGVR